MIGLHFFNPAERMPLLEIICGRETSDQTLAKAVAFARNIKKFMLVVNDGPGFYVTRQLIALFAGLPYLLADGVDLGVIEGRYRFRPAPGAGVPGRPDRHRYRLSCESDLRPETGGSLYLAPPDRTDLSDRLLRP